MLKITVNGETRRVSAANVADLIEELDIKLKVYVVERNRKIVPRDKTADEPVEEGDEIEIVRLMGGG